MQRLLIVPFVVLSMLLVAATCVANVEQREDGSYAGRVSNAGDRPVHDPLAIARFKLVSTGEVWGRNEAPVCPQALLPGQRGAFELRHVAMPINDPDPGPSTVVFPRFAEESPGVGAYSGDDLRARVVSRDNVTARATVVVTNTGAIDFESIRLCAVHRATSGEIISVAFSVEHGTLESGASVELELTLSTLTDEQLWLYPSGRPAACCPHEYSGWVSITNQRFSVMLPPGWAYEPDQGIDSFIGTYGGDGTELRFDYGWYSNSLPYDNDPAYDVHEETIGGLTAKIARPEGGTGETGVYFGDVEGAQVGADPGRMRTKLTIVGQDLSAEEQEIALQIFRSIRFAP